MRTLKEQCLYLHRFQTLEEARAIIAEFIKRYNDEWLIERLGYRTPAQARAEGWRAPLVSDNVSSEVFSITRSSGTDSVASIRSTSGSSAASISM